MIKAVATQFYFGAIYDVSVQGGAVGSIATGLKIPKGGIIAIVTVEPLIQCVSAGGGNFSFGVAGDLGRYGAYSHLVFGAVGSASVNLNQKTSTGDEVLISIDTNVITQGKIKIHWTLVVVNGK